VAPTQMPDRAPQQGTFDGAHAIKNFLLPSHIVGLDYDHVKDRLQVIQRCAADPHTVAAIESPTDGVKVFAYVPNSVYDGGIDRMNAHNNDFKERHDLGLF